MAAVGAYRSVRLSWTNPKQRDLAFTAIWASQTNDLLTAIRVGIAPAPRHNRPQSWGHQHLTPGDVWYYWTRAVDKSGNVSTWFPESPTAGWVATVTAIPDGDLPASVGHIFSVGFASVTTVTILGVTHGLGTLDLSVTVWDTQSPHHMIGPDDVTVADATFDVVVTFAVAQSGRIVLIG